ncbi:CLUMA_CG008033, isoform A [Clunio marinus]|uniref:CLUMA_CG008033, isoform A n=1 Tax=Clunio marinus TaxID=568069 RepID=A0A1J1I449_9DIPT|nr:CLUMA_CG008033, isoform A [Clunio marinus]
MQYRRLTLFNKLSLLATLLITVYATKAQAEECGHEELNKCSKSLQALKSATDLSFAPKREELAELCPDLEAGLRCIRSYTRRCMTLPQRQQFMKIYKGTDDVIRDLCREGDYQNEFLKHAACLRTVKPQHKKCEEKYQETMLSLKTPRVNQTMQNEQQTEQNTNDDVRKFIP